MTVRRYPNICRADQVREDSKTEQAGLRNGRCVAQEGVCTGMDLPIGPWGEIEVAFWIGTARYQPWKDVAAFFKGS